MGEPEPSIHAHSDLREEGRCKGPTIETAFLRNVGTQLDNLQDIQVVAEDLGHGVLVEAVQFSEGWRKVSATVIFM